MWQTKEFILLINLYFENFGGKLWQIKMEYSIKQLSGEFGIEFESANKDKLTSSNFYSVISVFNSNILTKFKF